MELNSKDEISHNFWKKKKKQREKKYGIKFEGCSIPQYFEEKRKQREKKN